MIDKIGPIGLRIVICCIVTVRQPSTKTNLEFLPFHHIMQMLQSPRKDFIKLYFPVYTAHTAIQVRARTPQQTHTHNKFNWQLSAFFQRSSFLSSTGTNAWKKWRGEREEKKRRAFELSFLTNWLLESYVLSGWWQREIKNDKRQVTLYDHLICHTCTRKERSQSTTMIVHI